MKKTPVIRNGLFGIAMLLIGLSCTHTATHYPGPLSPEESMKSFHFADDFKAEIFAAEPLIADPVSMVFDADGNAYVVEMPDANMPDSIKGKGRIVLLKDTDGDGRADHADVFADSLNEATSILPWKGGLIVAAAPDISYYKDTNGDGHADSKEVLFSGFFKHNEEAQITSLHFSIDNWIYANNDGQAGEIGYNLKPDSPKLHMQGADFRFRLDRNQFELSTGPGQFGQAIDDWGERFFSQNTLHIREVVIPWRYLHRHDDLPPSAQSAILNISDHDPLMFQLTDAPYWRAERTKRRNKEYQENHLDRVEYEKGHFSGASGGAFYNGDAFPEAYYGNIFTGDVSGNLVHRDILSPVDSSPVFVARRGKSEGDKEFLASTDSWFRPASFAVGPDGCLYVVDMYRQHIETPVSIPDDLKAEMDFKAGGKYGRIYRIVPRQAPKYQKKTSDLKDLSSVDLVKALSNSNRWRSLQAQRLLLERQDKSVLPAVNALFSQSGDPRVRLQAMYVVEGLNGLTAETVNRAMKDPSAGVRKNGIMLAERFPECFSGMVHMINDSSIRVVFQASLSLGNAGKSAVEALAKIIERHGSSPWFRTAVLSSDAGSSNDLLQRLIQHDSFFHDTASWKLGFLKDFAYVVGARNQKEQVIPFLEILSQALPGDSGIWQVAGVKGLTQGLAMSEGADSSKKDEFENLDMKPGVGIRKTIRDLTSSYSNSSKK